MLPDQDELEAVLAAAQDRAARFFETLEHRPPAMPFEAGVPLELREQGLGAVGAIDLLWDRYGEAFAGSTGPRYWGYVQGGVTPAALAADWLCSALDQTGQMHGDSPAVAIEAETIAMLRDLLDLPPAFFGMFLSGGTMANFVGLAIGLQRLGAQRGVNVSANGVGALGRVRVLTGECHACVPRSCGLLGIGRDAVETLPLDRGGESVSLDALKRRLDELVGEPVIVVGNAGTVITGGFDDLDALANLTEERGAHLHVDAASGLFARASKEHHGLAKGIERADTIAGDAHKWLNVPYDSGLIFSRHPNDQNEMFKNISAYLPPPELNLLNYPNLGPENSRRLRALPAWATLQAYGRDGYRRLVERSCDLARALGELIDAEPDLELAAPVTFNVVCFRLLDGGVPANAETCARFVDRLTRTGGVRVNNSVFEGRPCIRLAILNWRTTADDLSTAISQFRSCLARVRQDNSNPEGRQA